MALRAEKGSDTQVHETLYKNLHVLMQLHPPPNKELHNVLKKDMFIKNNRTAFNEVVYYLLYVLNPDRLKKKITSWPVFDHKSERQFRTEVMKYLHELNEIYENANLPLIMASQLVSPGGSKFVKYMLKLSILVMTQCVCQNEDVQRKILLKPTMQKGGESAKIKKLNVLTSCINKETEKLRVNFHLKFIKYKETANAIVDKLNEAQCELLLFQEKLTKVQSTAKEESNVEINVKIELILQKLKKIKENSDKLSKIKDLVKYLTKCDLPLENRSCNELDLIATLEQFNMRMEKLCFEMRTYTDLELNQHIEKFVKCNEELVRLKNDWVDIYQESMKLSEIMKTTDKRPALFEASESSTVLAVPLEDSKS